MSTASDSIRVEDGLSWARPNLRVQNILGILKRLGIIYPREMSVLLSLSRLSVRSHFSLSTALIIPSPTQSAHI